MKKLLCILLSVVMILSCCFVFAGAKTTYRATWTLKANANGTSYNSGNVITVKPGDQVKVTVHLSNNYYTGPTCLQLFYSKDIFDGAAKGNFNTSGKLYRVSGSSNSTCVDWDRLHPGNRDIGWPNYSASKLQEFKASHQFIRVTMTPSVMITTTAVKDLDEDLLTITFTVSSSATPGSEGEIILPIESQRTKNYTTGFFYSSIYKTSDMTGQMMMYSDDQVFNCNNASLKFKIASSSQKGDVNKDGKINSTDALLVLQSSVGSISLSSEQKTLADVNSDNKVNSTDALKILQYSVGSINKF